jgi:hypothetical protein
MRAGPSAANRHPWDLRGFPGAGSPCKACKRFRRRPRKGRKACKRGRRGPRRGPKACEWRWQRGGRGRRPRKRSWSRRSRGSGGCEGFQKSPAPRSSRIEVSCARHAPVTEVEGSLTAGCRDPSRDLGTSRSRRRTAPDRPPRHRPRRRVARSRVPPHRCAQSLPARQRGSIYRDHDHGLGRSVSSTAQDECGGAQ